MISEKSFLQFSVKTKDNENWIYTGSVKTKDNENSSKHVAVKTVKSDLSMKYQTSDIPLIIYRFSLYLLSHFCCFVAVFFKISAYQRNTLCVTHTVKTGRYR